MTRLFPEQTRLIESELKLELAKRLDSSSERLTNTNKLAKYLLQEAVDLNKIFLKKLIGDIEEDPKNILGKPIRKDRPEIIFKEVLIAKFWDGKSDRDLSDEWNIPYTTIRSFFLRELEKIKFELAEYLQ